MAERWILFGVLLAAFGVLLLQQYLVNRAPEYVGEATVVSRRIQWGRQHSRGSVGWNYLVTFRLGDGEELELNTGEEEYNSLPEGLRGVLRWQNTDFRHFEAQK